MKNKIDGILLVLDPDGNIEYVINGMEDNDGRIRFILKDALNVGIGDNIYY